MEAKPVLLTMHKVGDTILVFPAGMCNSMKLKQRKDIATITPTAETSAAAGKIYIGAGAGTGTGTGTSPPPLLKSKELHILNTLRFLMLSSY